MDTRTTLTVYIITGCANCEFARELAAEAGRAYPALRVQVLDLSQVADPPDTVFATPTYLLDGKVISLGNPDPQELLALLAHHTAASVTATGAP